MERARTQADVEELGRTTKLAPKVTDFIGRKGFRHRQELNPRTGKVEDVVNWTTNVNGKKTRAAHEVEEAMGSFIAADVDRHKKLQSKIDREAMIDAQGSVRYIEPHMTDYTALRNNWHHRFSAGGVRGVSLAGAYERGRATFCQECERHVDYCVCGGGSEVDA